MILGLLRNKILLTTNQAVGSSNLSGRAKKAKASGSSLGAKRRRAEHSEAILPGAPFCEKKLACNRLYGPFSLHGQLSDTSSREIDRLNRSVSDQGAEAIGNQ